MMKVTKIVTLSVVFVVSMSQVIAQDPSQIEIEEKAYVVSDKGVGFRKYPSLLTLHISFLYLFYQIL